MIKLLIFYILLLHYIVNANVPIGHKKPLGSHRPAENGPIELENFPNAKILHENFVLTSTPAIFKNAVKDWPALKKWNDKYIGDNGGKKPMMVELAKKETRVAGQEAMHAKEFIKKYKNEDIYMLGSLSNNLLKDIQLPKAYRTIMRVPTQPTIWLSSGGTKSLLHRDGEENINCAIDGEKYWVLIDKKYVNEVYESDKYPGYGERSPFDVDSVDLIKWPKFQNVPWFNITLRAGDCLYLPGNWFHHVRSPNNQRNLAVNIWWTQPHKSSKLDYDALPHDMISLDDQKFWSWTRLDAEEGVRLDPYDGLQYGDGDGGGYKKENNDDDDDGWGDDDDEEEESRSNRRPTPMDDEDEWDVDEDEDEEETEARRKRQQRGVFGGPIVFQPTPESPEKTYERLWDLNWQKPRDTLPLEPPKKKQDIYRKVQSKETFESTFVDDDDLEDWSDDLKEDNNKDKKEDNREDDDEDDDEESRDNNNNGRNNEREDEEEGDDDEWDDNFDEEESNENDGRRRNEDDEEEQDDEEEEENDGPGDGLDWNWRKELLSSGKSNRGRGRQEEDDEDDNDDADWD